MKFRLVSLLMIVCLLLTVVFTGCGTKDNNVGSSSAESTVKENTQAVQEDVTLRVINFRVEDKAFYDEFNAKFEKQYPNIHVTYDVIPTKDWGTFRMARFASGDVDLFPLGGESDINQPQLNQYMADMQSQPFFENIFPDVLKAGQKDGKQLFLPEAAITLNVFYNKKMFADLGISIHKTWNEYVETCEKIKSNNIDPIIFGGKDQWPINMIIDQLEAGLVSATDPNFYAGLRTEQSKFDDPRWVEVFKRLKTLSTYFQKNSPGLAYAQAPGLFAQGKGAMTIDGSWSLAQIEDAKPEFEVGAFLLPSSDDANNNNVAETKYGFGWCMYEGTKNKDAALKYLEFFNNPDNYQGYIDIVRMLPVLKEAKTKSPLAKEIGNLIQRQLPIWENYVIPGSKCDYTVYGMEVCFANLTPEKAAETMQKDLIGSKDKWK